MTLYFERLAAAYVRASLDQLPEELRRPPLDEVDWDAIIAQGLQAELRIHRFKRTMDLARVQKVLGILRGLQPARLLDIGTGRGAFLWPLLDAFPWLEVVCSDVLDYRVSDIQKVAQGGVTGLQALHCSVEQLPLELGSFDVVTMLEVLEHLEEPLPALERITQLSHRAVILSFPSKEDNNPEHLHVFRPESVQKWLYDLGWKRVKYEAVLNHWVVLALKDEGLVQNY